MQINLHNIIPQKEAVLRSQGFPGNTPVKERIRELLSKAMEIFAENAQPAGILSEVSIYDFKKIFRGAGKNAPEKPLQHIFPCADRLALFALTMGSKVSTKIEECFLKNNFALGSMLDSVTSLAAENAVELYEKYFHNKLSRKKNTHLNNCVLSYSPGYCGWHISGQKKIFKCLQPEKIGISLNDNFLMSPIKSVTGVLVDGKKEIHIFETNFPFCSSCKHHSCSERMKNIVSQID
ncbi:MAG: hypothetical protein KAX05_09560 [Bacteroidales bacterium]|nr:hypothetical protein [Bacteroidales bacterium]